MDQDKYQASLDTLCAHAERKNSAFERIAAALERIADQGDEIETHLSFLAGVSGDFRDAVLGEERRRALVFVVKTRLKTRSDGASE